MKTARFLLACVAASLLAACSADSITAPATPARPSFDESVGGDEGGGSIDDTGGGTGNCMLTVIINADGSLSWQCQAVANGQIGSGS